MDNLSDRKVLFVIPQARFKDEELDVPRRFLERKKIAVKVAAPAKKPCFGMGGMRALVDFAFDDVDANAFDLIYFVGGMGTKDIFDNQSAHRIVQEAVAAGKIVAASSFAPILLGRAGVLNGREATVYFSETKALEATGAKYNNSSSVVVDGNIITCKGAEAGEKFSLALIKFLTDLKASGQAG